jgi:hypothetical protein
LCASFFSLRSFFFLVAVVNLHSRFTSRAEAIDKAATTAADFAVLVWGIPRDATEEQIRLHFDRYGALAQDQAEASTQARPDHAERGDENGARGGDGEDCVEAFHASPELTPRKSPVPMIEADAPRKDDVQDNMDGVAAVHIARRDQRLLEQLGNLAELQDAFDDLRFALAKNPPSAAVARAKAKMTKLQSQLSKRVQAIRKLREGKGRFAVCAFVMFRSEAARDACLGAYNGPDSRVYTWECWGQRMDLRLDSKHRLKVVRAVEPSDVLWENLECTWCGMRARQGETVDVFFFFFCFLASGCIWYSVC